ncbi:HugZ family protein [Szabonella alba]|uniref:Pyridoxamine 5'-phosphate oxidase family protein n=1 Tax=Szabonella alba TaxID=2804194 RepID=A0A8K0V645_9RHOB|nr:pyridoxamine 5'-phosphate oxidase family protein [Szabonella alba]MBL4916132.1 pyridoxamine 5'-phosphate oxidase family protein [Szabonella alba]
MPPDPFKAQARTPEPGPRPDPLRPADGEALDLTRRILREARFAALAWTDPETGTPGISRVALGLAPDGGPVTLISALAPHSAALHAHPACALLVGEPGAKGDPLTHPRLMIRAEATFVHKDDPARDALRAHWLADHPKSTLYIDFPDFAFVRLRPVSALLNAGFARAFRIGSDDLTGQ